MAATYARMPPGAFEQPQWDAVRPQDQVGCTTAAERTFELIVGQVDRQPMDSLHDYGRRLKSKRSVDSYNGRYQAEQQMSQHHSLLSNNSRKRSIGTGMNAQVVDEETAWIHRDKLAQIESKEMAEAGIDYRSSGTPRHDRARSRSASRVSYQRRRDEQDGDTYGGAAAYSEEDLPTGPHHDYPQQRSPQQDFESHRHDMISPMHDETDGEEAVDDSEHYTQTAVPFQRDLQSYNRQVARPATSRIPVSRNSPAPVSTNVINRDSPSIRSRNNSNAWNSSPEDGKRLMRPRSQSLGSYNAGSGRPMTPQSPPRSRPASSHLTNSPKQMLTSSPNPRVTSRGPASQPTGRKTNNGTRVLSGSHSRTASLQNKHTAGQRPRSIGRPPGPINRPEGEPPWLADMHKPDPRLPPDQQILPTHAKRMMREQGEGSANSTPDRNMPMSNDLPSSRDRTPIRRQTPVRDGLPVDTSTTNRINAGAAPRLLSEYSQQGSLNEQHWQQPSPQIQPWSIHERPTDSGAGASRSNSASAGGYRITPSIHNSVAPASPLMSQRSMSIIQQRQQEASMIKTRLPAMPSEKNQGKKEKEKGCGCCIVM